MLSKSQANGWLQLWLGGGAGLIVGSNLPWLEMRIPVAGTIYRGGNFDSLSKATAVCGVTAVASAIGDRRAGRYIAMVAFSVAFGLLGNFWWSRTSTPLANSDQVTLTMGWGLIVSALSALSGAAGTAAYRSAALHKARQPSRKFHQDQESM